MRLPGINEPADREGGYDIAKAAYVVRVRMGCHHHIEALDTPRPDIRYDALPHITLAGIDEHGLIAELYKD